MALNVMLEEALDAIAHGQKDRARDLLTRLLRADQANPTYWLWLSAVVESAKERTYCLQNVLRLDPQNRSAHLGLILGGQLLPGDPPGPEPILPRAWTPAGEDSFVHLRRNSSPRRRLILAGFISLLLLLVIFGGLGLRNGSSGKAGWLTVTPIFHTSTITPSPLPSQTPRPRRTSAVRTSPTPLWLLLEATYTSTPLSINTPHPISEAYQAGIRALQSGDYLSMRNYMEQAAREEPGSADLQYYIGEAYRLFNNPQAALSAYLKSLEIDPLFAPAWLGKARAGRAIDPDQDVLPDLQTAIEIDPDLVEAYLFRAQIRTEMDAYEAALEDLAEVEFLAPQSPALFLYRAQAYLGLGDAEAALENASRARQLDQASLPAYFALGMASLISNQPARAAEALQTYLAYQPEDATAWRAFGQAAYSLGVDFPAAEKALTRALALQPDDFPALLFRGLVYLEMDEGQLAVNDLFSARKLDRQSFPATLGLGRGLMLTGRLPDSISVISSSQTLAQTDQELAQVHYWRAVARQAAGESHLAAKDWRELLALPASAMPAAWRDRAEQMLLLLTPTATPTFTRTPPTPATSRTLTAPGPSSTATRRPGTATKTPAPSQTGAAETPTP